jgi:hypothetical protein
LTPLLYNIRHVPNLPCDICKELLQFYLLEGSGVGLGGRLGGRLGGLEGGRCGGLEGGGR